MYILSSPGQIKMLLLLLFFLLLLFGFWATTGDSQGLLLAVHSGITLNVAWGTNWNARDQTWFGCMQGNHVTRSKISPTQ